MVARSAYAQLRYSPLLLAGTVVGMALTYLAPPLLALFGQWRRAGDRPRGLGADGGRVSCRPCGSTGSRSGAWRCRPLRACTCCSRSIPPISTCADEAGCGRGGRKPTCRDRDDDCLPNCGPARATGTRIFRSRRGSSVRAIADRSWRSTISCAPPTISPTIATLAAGREARLARSARSDAARQQRRRTGRRSRCASSLPSASLSPRHAQDLLTAFRMDVTKLRYRDWDDLIDYCTLFGHAGRPLRARRAWREPCDLAGQRRAVRGAADHQSSAGLREGLSRLDRVYIPLDAFAAAGATVEALGARTRHAGAAGMPPRSSRSAPANAARRQRAVLGRDRGLRGSPWRSPSSSRLARASDRDAAAARSAERARASRQGRDRGPRPRRADPWRDLADRPGIFRDAASRRRRVSGAVDADSRFARQPAAQRASGSSFYTAMRILPRAQREAMFEIYSFCRQVDDIADFERPARGAARRARPLARRYRRALRAAKRATACDGLDARRAAVRICEREDFLAVIDGMEMDARGRHPRARASRRSTSTATGWRAPSAGCRCACSAWRRRTASRSRIISAARCSSPTSCATSTRTPAIGRLYLPREALRAAGITTNDPVDGAREPGARPGLRRMVERARSHFAEADAHHGALPAPTRQGAAHHGRGLPLILDGWSRAAGAPPRASGPHSARAACCGSSCATRSSDAAHRPHHRRRACRPCRRGAARRRAASDVVVHEATGHAPAGAAAPITIPRSA